MSIFRNLKWNDVLVLAGLLFVGNDVSATIRIDRTNGPTAVIHAPSGVVSVHCSREDKEDKNSFTYLYVVSENRIESISFRRPWSLEECHYRRAKIKKILSANNKILIGVSEEMATEPDTERDDLGTLPPSPAGRKKAYSWTFEYVKGGSLCEGYFKHSCDRATSRRAH